MRGGSPDAHSCESVKRKPNLVWGPVSLWVGLIDQIQRSRSSTDTAGALTISVFIEYCVRRLRRGLTDAITLPPAGLAEAPEMSFFSRVGRLGPTGYGPGTSMYLIQL